MATKKNKNTEEINGVPADVNQEADANEEANEEAAGEATSESAAPGATETAGEPQPAGAPEVDEEEAHEIAAAFAEAQAEMKEALNALRTELSQIKLDETRDRVVKWIDENPTLAVLLAVGGGVVIGRLLYNAFKPAPPPPLTERARRQLLHMAHQAQHFADEVGEVVADRASETSKVLASRASETGKVLASRASETGKVLRHRAEVAGETLAHQSRVWSDEIARTASKQADKASEAAHDVAVTVRKRAEKGYSFTGGALSAAKTAIAAVVVKRVADWIKQVR